MATVWLNKVDCETGNLPNLCLRCGRPTTHRVEKDLHGTLVWVDPMSVFSIPDETTRLRVPLCERHQHHWRNRCLFLAGVGCSVVLGIVGGFFVLASLDEMHMWPMLLSFLTGGAVALVVAKRSGLRALEVYQDNVEVTGVHEAFANAYQGKARDIPGKPLTLHPEDRECPLGLDPSVTARWEGGATRRQRVAENESRVHPRDDDPTEG